MALNTLTSLRFVPHSRNTPPYSTLSHQSTLSYFTSLLSSLSIHTFFYQVSIYCLPFHSILSVTQFLSFIMSPTAVSYAVLYCTSTTVFSSVLFSRPHICSTFLNPLDAFRFHSYTLLFQHLLQPHKHTHTHPNINFTLPAL